MRIVDPHHHLWNVEENSYPWLSEDHDRGWGDWSSLRRNYLLADYLHDAANQDLVASVHVQANFDARRPEGETEWLENVAEAPGSGGFPNAIVAFADLSAPDAEQAVARQAGHARVRGIRQVLNRHPDPARNRAPRDYLADPVWRDNFSTLARHGLSFDAQVYYQQMPHLAGLADAHPDTVIILDHCGMPVERDEQGLSGWREGMRRLSQCRNVLVKLSGFGMVDLSWTEHSIRPFVRHAIDVFGPSRCMFASNFPVDKLMATYDDVWSAYQRLVDDLSHDEQQALFSGTALRAYRIKL